MSAKAKNPLREFNLNSIIVLAATALVGWLVTTGLGSIKSTHDTVIQTQTSIAKIETAVPYINQTVTNLQNDLNTKNVALTQSISEIKTDVKTGQTQTWAAIKDVRDNQNKLQEKIENRKK